VPKRIWIYNIGVNVVNGSATRHNDSGVFYSIIFGGSRRKNPGYIFFLRKKRLILEYINSEGEYRLIPNPIKYQTLSQRVYSSPELYNMKSIRVRFNLGKGPNYMKWKIQYPDGRVDYKDPNTTQLVLEDCILKNHQGVAKRIYEGGNKTVCAWILCKKIQFKKIKLDGEIEKMKVQYNPRHLPFWIYKGDIVDGMGFDRICSQDKGLYVL
jgi:hypothetical protein